MIAGSGAFCVVLQLGSTPAGPAAALPLLRLQHLLWSTNIRRPGAAVGIGSSVKPTRRRSLPSGLTSTSTPKELDCPPPPPLPVAAVNDL